MTDKEKLEKVKAEIERRYKYNKEHENDWAGTSHFWQRKEDKEILSFIDSMQEECNITGIKSKHATGKLKECIDNITDESLAKARKQLQEELVNGGLDLGCGVIWKDEKSASEELEKVVEEIVDPTVLNAYGVKETANRLRRTIIESVSEEQVKELLISKHDDKTCKENGNSLTQEPISDDLDQAIDAYLATYFGGEKEKQDWPFLKKMAIHFAAWQKQQLMAEGFENNIKALRQKIWDYMAEHPTKDRGVIISPETHDLILEEVGYGDGGNACYMYAKKFHFKIKEED